MIYHSNGACVFDRYSLAEKNFNSKFIFKFCKETEITPNIRKSGVIKFNGNDERIDEPLNDNDFRGIVESQVSEC